MIPPEVRAVFFDAVGTLIHPQPSAAAVYAAVGRRFGTRRTEEEIAARFPTAFARGGPRPGQRPADQRRARTAALAEHRA